MEIRIWLDDKRPAPFGYTWCKTAEQAEQILSNSKIKVSHISFDHDLGIGLNGYYIASLIEEMANYDLIKRITWDVHSDNPAGRKRIAQAMKSADRFWKMYEDKQ